MTCSYCRYPNLDDEHRCRRCGRPLSDSYAMATSGALATVPQPVRRESPPVAPPPAVECSPRQARLFHEKPTGKVIPFEALTSPELEAPLIETPAKARTVTRTSRGVQARRTAAPSDRQPSLDFLPPSPRSGRKPGAAVEAVIFCDAPVATPTHRAFATAIDGSMILIAFGLFLVTFRLLGGVFAFDKLMVLMLGASAALIGVFYGFVYVWGSGRTPGMRATGLTLIHFDGYPPDRVSRWMRYLAACLSYCACGLGILWALVDEESLAWHDHISKTFPTFSRPETNFVRHR
jgi:uncharacterized RDD family membrane protein YckC